MATSKDLEEPKPRFIILRLGLRPTGLLDPKSQSKEREREKKTRIKRAVTLRGLAGLPLTLDIVRVGLVVFSLLRLGPMMQTSHFQLIISFVGRCRRSHITISLLPRLGRSSIEVR